MSTPADDGFRMPAEWEPHERCWMAWPCREQSWGGELEAAREAYAAVAKAIAAFEPVTMIANPPEVAAASLSCGAGVEVLSLPHDDSWTRDTGPSFVTGAGGRVAGVDWRFDGWGGLVDRYDQDAALASRVLAHLEMPRYPVPLGFEGGAIHVDGEGTGLTTEAVVLDPRRNPGLGRVEAEAVLRAHLGLEKLIWLGQGLEDDDTGGHVDNVACFARPGVVLLLQAAEDDPNRARLEDNFDRLRGAIDAKGRELEVHRLAQPPRRDRRVGRRMPLSHINFYLANGALIMPVFEHQETDTAARRSLAQL
ncbi:MAG: agmatine/peptidylarginine deiminase, partial [Kiloniellales bacterium]